MQPIPLDYKDFPSSQEFLEGMNSVPFQKYHRIGLQEIIYDEENHLKILYIHHGEKKPFVFYVQGSAWMDQDLYCSIFELYEFAKKGYNVAIAQYRGTGYGPFPLQVQDSKRALKYMTDHYEQYHVDLDNIFLWGDSSGGHTVMMMAVTHNRLFQEFKLPEIRGVVDFYGPTHIATMNDYPSTQDHMGPDSPEGRLIGGLSVPEHPDLADQTIVMNYIAKEIPLVPVLILHGTKDRLVPYHQSIELYECLKKNEKNVTFYRIEEGDHGGEFFWHEKSLEIVDGFMKEFLLDETGILL